MHILPKTHFANKAKTPHFVNNLLAKWGILPLLAKCVFGKMSCILLFLCFFLASFPSFLFLFFPSSSVSVKSYSLRPTEKKHPFVRVIYLLLISNDFVTCLRKVSFFCVMNALKPMSEKKIFFGGKDMYVHTHFVLIY
ncbi:unnamed protein product [Meloidogyne enterolobii]|uniref:Uncharacterized protein n=1 Tax=Meloidogyne enterolobii TaxID=390850 RepID=A0ACB0Z5X3_MELEN